MGKKLWRRQVFRARKDARKERKRFKKVYFNRIQRGRLGAKVRPGKARFGSDLDGEKLWRRQVFRARKDARKERKRFILIGIQRGRLGAKVRPGEARFGLELDWEKPWLDQVVGARMREKKERKL